MEKHRLRVFENRVLRRTFGPKREEVTGDGGNFTIRSFINCALHHFIRRSISRRMG
jgi:hypothetical protein